MKLPFTQKLLLLALLLVAASAHADLGFPGYVKLPAQIRIDPNQALTKETLAEIEFESTAAGAPLQKQHGRHYARWLSYQPAKGEPAPGYYNGTEERIWKAISTTLAKSGWTLIYASEEFTTGVLRHAQDGHDAWLRITMDAPQAQVRLELIEAAEVASILVHPVPGAAVVKFSEQQAIPYLAPYPGSTGMTAGSADGPLDVSPAFANGSSSEPVLVGSRVVARSYQGPTTLSALQFMRDNRAALTQAGWKVLYPANPGADADEATLIAHYTEHGRDIWARLNYQHGASLSYQVVDSGSEDWSAQFDLDCHLPLYGVRFDFNKATLRPESDSLLNKAATVLKARPQLAVEVQGHTDNVGADDYNLKLSDARAASVLNWFVQHDVVATRLSAKGYGEQQPVADNATDAGRARNRRVELVSTACQR